LQPLRIFGFALLPHSGFREGMTLEAIKEAVVHLSEAEREQFAYWFEELAEEAWDKEIERDFAPGGRGSVSLEAFRAVVAWRVKPNSLHFIDSYGCESRPITPRQSDFQERQSHRSITFERSTRIATNTQVSQSHAEPTWISFRLEHIAFDFDLLNTTRRK